MLGCSQTSGNSPWGGKKAASRPANPANVANGASTVPAIADMAHLFSVDYGRPLILMNVGRGAMPRRYEAEKGDRDLARNSTRQSHRDGDSTGSCDADTIRATRCVWR